MGYGLAERMDNDLLLARDVGYLQTLQFENLSGQVLRVQDMLAGLHRALKKPRRSA
jgi:hypothetical protein